VSARGRGNRNNIKTTIVPTHPTANTTVSRASIGAFPIPLSTETIACEKYTVTDRVLSKRKKRKRKKRKRKKKRRKRNKKKRKEEKEKRKKKKKKKEKKKGLILAFWGTDSLYSQNHSQIFFSDDKKIFSK